MIEQKFTDRAEQIIKIGTHFKFDSEEKKESVLAFFKLKQKIEVDLDWNDLLNEYEIFENSSYYLLHTITEYFGLGTEYADYYSDIWNIYPREWRGIDITLHHWEDGNFPMKLFPEKNNRVNYMLNTQPPKGAIRFRDFEYNDFDSQPREYEWIITE